MFEAVGVGAVHNIYSEHLAFRDRRHNICCHPLIVGGPSSRGGVALS